MKLLFVMCSLLLFSFQQFNSEIKRRVDCGYNQTIVAAYVLPNTTEYHYAASQQLASPENLIFEIGSITKLFTAHLVLILEQEGLLSLDIPVQHYLPNIKISESFTLRHLLSHTSGLVDPSIEGYSLNGNTVPVADYSIEDLYTFLNQTTLRFKPGTQVHYSNAAYGLVGHILEKVSQKTYGELLSEKIFIPLHMKNSFVDSQEKRSIQGFCNTLPAPPWCIRDLPAFGAIKSTAHDLAIYLRFFFFTKKDEGLKEKLLTPYLQFNHDPLLISTIGWTIDNRFSGHLFAVAGRTLGFSCFMGFSPDLQQGLIVLTDASAMDNLGNYGLNPSFPLEKIHQSQPVDPIALQTISGTYIGQDNETVVVKAEPNYIELLSQEDPPYRLYPLDKTTFFSKSFDSASCIVRFNENQFLIETEYDTFTFAKKIK